MVSNSYPIGMNEELIQENVHFILSHVTHQHELFPRTIIRGSNRYWDIIPYEVDEQNSISRIVDLYKQSNFIDCRINAFPYNTKHSIDFDVKNMTAASLIMVDLDLNQFRDEVQMNKHLQKILKKLDVKFKGLAHPTVLHTGNGYHIYQPIGGIVLEKEQIFYDFLPYLNGRDLTTEFMRFAEKYFARGKADRCHHPSINNCMLRIPGTINSKNGKVVKIIERWDGVLPSVRYVASDYFDYLIAIRNEVIQERKKADKLKSKMFASNSSHLDKIDWIERLIKTPIEDCRKTCLWRIVIPYLINVKRLGHNEASIIVSEWLKKCNELERLSFRPSLIVRAGLKGVGSYWPPRLDTLKRELPDVYKELKSKDIFTK